MNYLICGAPGSGKSTYVKKNKRWNDYVIDLDEICRAITFNELRERPYGILEYLEQIYFKIIDILQTDKDKNKNIYIIRCAPTLEEREFFKNKYNTTNILIKTHLTTCQRRRCDKIKHIGIRDRIIKYVTKWFDNYEDGLIDRVIKGY